MSNEGEEVPRSSVEGRQQTFFSPAHQRTAESQSTRTSELESGRRIGSFRLIEFVARGGMGEVWRAEDVNLRRDVALKFVRPECVDSDSLRRFAREARAGGRAAHPNLVTTLGYGDDEAIAWIAQEFVEGCWTLKDAIADLRSEGNVDQEHYLATAEFHCVCGGWSSGST